MEGVPYDLSGYLSSEGLSDMMPAGSGLHGGQAGDGFHEVHREEPHYFGSRSGLPLTDLDSPQNHSAPRMIQAGHTAECPSTPMHAWHNPPLTSQYETYNTDESQGYDIAGCVHSDYAQDLAQVPPNDETIPSEDQYRTQGNAGTLEPSEAEIDSVPSQQVLGSTVSQTGTDRDVSKLGPDELNALLLEQACHCATCLDGYWSTVWTADHPLKKDRFWVLPERTLSCRITGCQWTTEDLSELDRPIPVIMKLLRHEGSGEREVHYGRPGDWRCREIDCKFVTKRWNDFLRHSTSKHCIKPRDLKCPFLECKYHHVDFSRKDKLKSHVDKVHKGTPHPGKPNQTIKLKAKDHA